MAKKISLLVDTDIFIDYFNHQLFREFFEAGRYQIFYSVVSKKELLAKKGLSTNQAKEIRAFLKKLRMIGLNPSIAEKYSELRRRHPQSEKEDCLIAATSIVKKLPLFTRNYKHYHFCKELKLFFPGPRRS